MTVTLPNEVLLDELLGKLESVRSWSPRVISKLETLISTGDDYALFRVNPIQFATEKGIAETEGIDLFLYSARLGLFEMEWHLVCASCGNVVDSFRFPGVQEAITHCNITSEQVVVKGVSEKLRVYRVTIQPY